MAGDWIKMRTGLRRNPKVIAMTRHLVVDTEFMTWWADPVRKTVRDSVTEIVTFEIVTRVTVTGLLEVWGAVNEADKGDGHLPYMRLIDIDDIAGMPGFGQAMMSVGWVRFFEDDESKGLEFPNFQEFNTPDSKRKGPKSDAQRAKEYRERKKAKEAKEEERHERHDSSRREEKRREENKSPPNPPEGEQEELIPPARFSDFWQFWPNKVAKANAEKAWKKLKPTTEDLAMFVQAIEAKAERLRRYEEDGGPFEATWPNPATWLNGRRWEDQGRDDTEKKEAANWK